MADMICEAPGCERKSRSSFRGKQKVCGLHYQRLSKFGCFEIPPKIEKYWSLCVINDCGKRSLTRIGRRCEMHATRMRRRGNYDDPVYGARVVTEHGYITLQHNVKRHPITPKGGVLYEHRKVLFDAIGDGEHKCHWCARLVNWRKKGVEMLVVDHLDTNKQNNNLGNLVASCHRCNSSRGLFMNWVIKHRDDPFLSELFASAKGEKIGKED